MSATDGSGTRERVLARIREDSRFALATHEHPDGDALGSLVAMQELLGALGKDSVMYVSPDDLPLPSEYEVFVLDAAIHAPPPDIAERTVSCSWTAATSTATRRACCATARTC